MTAHKLPHGWAPRAAFAGDGPGLWRGVGHTSCELEFQLHVLGQLWGGGRREDSRLGQCVSVLCSAEIRCNQVKSSAVGRRILGCCQLTHACRCAACADTYLKQASTQSLEGDTEGAGTALAGESQVVEGGLAHNGVLRVWYGTAFIADIWLLPWGGGKRPRVVKRGPKTQHAPKPNQCQGRRKRSMQLLACPSPTPPPVAANQPSVEEGAAAHPVSEAELRPSGHPPLPPSPAAALSGVQTRRTARKSCKLLMSVYVTTKRRCKTTGDSHSAVITNLGRARRMLGNLGGKARGQRVVCPPEPWSSCF